MKERKINLINELTDKMNILKDINDNITVISQKVNLESFYIL
ncbi:MAG: hypothetical protein ACRCVJ_05355 [Clostridium sp.]